MWRSHFAALPRRRMRCRDVPKGRCEAGGGRIATAGIRRFRSSRKRLKMARSVNFWSFAPAARKIPAAARWICGFSDRTSRA
jgi:hypothetical protein